MKYILIAVPKTKESLIENKLADNYSLSINMASQEAALDAIPKIKPDALIIHEELKGSRSIQDFYKIIKKTYPALNVIFYKENEDIISDYIEGVREVPEYFINEDEKESNQINDVTEEITEEQLTKDNQEDWEKVSNISIDLSKNLKKTIAITGATGGIGKTDLSINLATYAAQNGYKTCLLGFNLQNDDIAGRLGLNYLRGKKLTTAFELYMAGQLTAEALEDIFQDFKNLKVLIGVERPIESEEMTEEFFILVIKLLQNNYDLVIIDTENNMYSPAFLSVLNTVDNILVPVTTHTSTLEQIMDDIHEWKEEYDIPLNKIDFVLNKAGEGGFINEDHIQKNTGRDVIATIPYCKEIFLGAEREKPAVLRNTFKALKVKRQMDKILFRYTARKTKLKDDLKPTLNHLKKKVLMFGKNTTS